MMNRHRGLDEMNPDYEHVTRLRRLAKGYFSPEILATAMFVLLLFNAPLSEALNNILIVGLFIWWLLTQPAIHELRAASLYLLILVLFCLTPLISLATSTVGELSERIGDVTGAVKFALLLLPVYSLSTLNRTSLDLVTACLTAGALIASVEAFVMWQYPLNPYPVLRALAGANGSALYMSLVLISAISLSWSPKLLLSIPGYAGIMISLSFSLVTRSVTAIAVSACVLFLAIALSMFTRRRKVFLTVSACLAILSATALTVSDAHLHWTKFTDEFRENVYGGNIGSKRFEIFNTASEVFDRNLWFGAGYRQFGKATSVRVVAEELEKEGRSYQSERIRFFHVNHGHNIWTQVLVERGLVGIGLLLAFFLATAIHIFRNVVEVYRNGERDLELVQLVFISCAAWTMLFVGGIGSSTFHTEHGMIALILLIWSINGFHISDKRMYH